jgi:hypothetical protein
MKTSKNKLNNLLKTGILFFGISLLLWNCKEEETFQEELTQVEQNASFGYRVTTLENIPKIIPTIQNIKKIKIQENNVFARDLSFLNYIENLNTQEVIAYTDEAGYSTYNFKFENNQQTINFENLHLLERKNGGYIGYILSYEPEKEWYYNHLNTEGKLIFNISDYQGEITKYSLEREIIWTTKGNENVQARGGSTWITVCTISPASCDEGNHDNGTGWNGCAYSSGEPGLSCSTVRVSGGGNVGSDPDNGGDPDTSGGGGNGNGEPCNDTSGTGFTPDNNAEEGVTSDCTPNNSNGTSTTASSYTTFWQGLSYEQQNYLNYNPTVKNQILSYLNQNQYAPQAVTEAEEAIDIFMDGGEVDLEEQIINYLIGKDKCAYKKMTELNLFRSTINKFEKNDNYTLTLKSWTSNACNNSSDDGCTDASDLKNGNITIYIQNSGKGTLDLAAIILHEGVHAEIFKYVDEYKKGLDPNNRPNLLSYYFQYKAQNDNTLLTSTAQHQHMADKFVKPIAEALRKLDNNKYPLNDYMGLAWDGLRRYGWDGYYDNGNWVTLDRNQYVGNINKVLDNTDFNKNCN